MERAKLEEDRKSAAQVRGTIRSLASGFQGFGALGLGWTIISSCIYIYISYHIISFHIIAYHIVSYHIILYHIYIHTYLGFCVPVWCLSYTSIYVFIHIHARTYIYISLSLSLSPSLSLSLYLSPCACSCTYLDEETRDEGKLQRLLLVWDVQGSGCEA